MRSARRLNIIETVLTTSLSTSLKPTLTMGACTSKPPTEPQAPLQLHPDLDSASRVVNIPVKEPNRIPENPVPAVITTPAKQINTTPVPTEAPEESLESIQVIVRIRPSEKQLSVVIKPPNSITITPPERAGPGNSPNPTKDAAIDYNNFDRVMDDCVTNEEVRRKLCPAPAVPLTLEP